MTDRGNEAELWIRAKEKPGGVGWGGGPLKDRSVRERRSTYMQMDRGGQLIKNNCP